MGLLKYLLNSFKSWWLSWIQCWGKFPATLILLLGKKVLRQEGNYIEICLASLRAGLKISFLPFRYVDNDSKDPRESTIALKPYSKNWANLHFILHLFVCVFHISIGLHWYRTVGRGIGLDAEAKKDLTWKKIILFYFTSLSSSTIPIVLIYRKRADQLKPLLTCTFQMEKYCVAQGAKGYVNRYMLLVIAFTIASCFNLPLIFFTATFLRPCLPFLTISLIAEECSDWEVGGIDNIPAKFVGGMIEWYYWVALTAVYLGIGWTATIYPGCVAARRIEHIFRSGF